MKEYKLLKTLMDELKESIIFNERAHDDDLEESFEDVLECSKQLHGALIRFINKNDKE